MNSDAYEPIHCEDINMHPTSENQPILFEHIYIKETKENLTDTTDVENSFMETDMSSYK